jgi:hypothetical protein
VSRLKQPQCGAQDGSLELGGTWRSEVLAALMGRE